MSTVIAAGGVIAQTIGNGPFLLAAPLALAAGAVSFASPCVLPLVPGYLSYVTGLSGAELAGAPQPTPLASTSLPPGLGSPTTGGGVAVLEQTSTAAPASRRGRVLVAGTLFILGFSLVFVSYGAAFGAAGAALRQHQRLVTEILGAITIVLGLAFMGLLPGLQREVRVHRLPAAGLAGAPVLGVLFGLGWAPCIGPTLAAVLSLSYTSATATRGALLTFVYCLGLGVPFLLVGLGVQQTAGAVAAIRRHSRTVMLVGGGLLVAIGVLQLSGEWARLVTHLQVLVGSYGTVI